MKIETCKGKWLVSALLLWLAFAPLAQAFYNPSTGRWLSRDPINEPGLKLVTRSRSLFNLKEENNLFAFTHNNPVNRVDIDGRVAPIVIVGVIAVGVGLGVCWNDLACRLHRNTTFAFAEGEANRYAPDGTTHWENRAGQQPVEGGDADALVHCIAACNMAKDPRSCGGLDRALDWIQRREVGNLTGTQLDRLNNENGFAIGMEKPTSCTKACLEAHRKGLLNEIRNNQIVPSSVEEQHEQ